MNSALNKKGARAVDNDYPSRRNWIFTTTVYQVVAKVKSRHSQLLNNFLLLPSSSLVERPIDLPPPFAHGCWENHKFHFRNSEGTTHTGGLWRHGPPPCWIWGHRRIHPLIPPRMASSLGTSRGQPGCRISHTCYRGRSRGLRCPQQQTHRQPSKCSVNTTLCPGSAGCHPAPWSPERVSPPSCGSPSCGGTSRGGHHAA